MAAPEAPTPPPEISPADALRAVLPLDKLTMFGDALADAANALELAAPPKPGVPAKPVVFKGQLVVDTTITVSESGGRVITAGRPRLVEEVDPTAIVEKPAKGNSHEKKGRIARTIDFFIATWKRKILTAIVVGALGTGVTDAGHNALASGLDLGEEAAAKVEKLLHNAARAVRPEKK